VADSVRLKEGMANKGYMIEEWEGRCWRGKGDSFAGDGEGSGDCVGKVK